MGWVEFKQVQVRPLSTKVAAIEWEVHVTNEDLNTWNFSLLRGNSPEGDEWDVLLQPTPAVFSFTDNRINTMNKMRETYYKVIAEKEDYRIESEVATISHMPDLVTLEIVRKNNLRLGNKHIGNGVECLLYIARNNGIRCPYCYDEIKGRKSVEMCDECWDTTWLYGFYAPITQFVNFNPSPKLVQMTPWGDRNPVETIAETSNYPILSSRDLIVDPVTNEHWRVISVQSPIKRKVLLRQMLKLEEIRRGEVQYKI